MTKVDVRSIKTKAKINTAMITLCNRNVAFETLTAPTVAKAAGISRQTFYRYYDSPKQVITQLIDQHLQEFFTAFQVQDLTARSMTSQLLSIWQTRPIVFHLVEWANVRIKFIQALSGFNQRIARHNGVHLIDEQAVCNVYAGTIYMFLREYVLQHRWDHDYATALLMHLTNNLDRIF